MRLSEARDRLKKNAAAMKDIDAEIREYAVYRDRLILIRAAYERELEFQRALKGMGDYGGLSCVTGYVPGDAAADLNRLAKDERWAISITDPSEEDDAPTFLRNPRWVSIISPIFKLIEIVPGYRELDISPLFLLFLSLFFGMIIGDAGYGLVYIALTALVQKRFAASAKDARIFPLLYLFSASAVMWGILTGTVFGQDWYISAGMKPLLPVLNDTRVLQAFCFFIGALHLTLGQGWQAARKFPSPAALADIGWISILWAAYFLARMLILGYTLPGFTKWLIIAGVALVIFFSNPSRNILVTIGRGLGTLALSIMNNFTDVVSYIRLFAVGMAGVAISNTTNALASEFGSGNVVLKLFILFLGHTINLLLGPISVLVHGIRLNVLEFSGHAGLTWSGSPYKPLK